MISVSPENFFKKSLDPWILGSSSSKMVFNLDPRSDPDLGSEQKAWIKFIYIHFGRPGTSGSTWHDLSHLRGVVTSPPELRAAATEDMHHGLWRPTQQVTLFLQQLFQAVEAQAALLGLLVAWVCGRCGEG